MSKASEWDRINNEGGEGFNPYRHTNDEFEPQPRTIETVRREWLAISPYDEAPAMVAKRNALRAELDAMEAEADAAFDAEWTVEVTVARRAEWNEWVMSHNGSPTPHQVEDQCRVQGFGLDDLRRAVKRHGL